MAVWGGLTNSCRERLKAKGKREMHPFECGAPENSEQR